MAQWKKKVPGTDIAVGGRDVPVGTPHFDPKKLVAEHTDGIRKESSDGPDVASAGDGHLVGAGYTWHRLPVQKPLTFKKKTPKLLIGPTVVEAADETPQVNVGKEDSTGGDEGTDSPDNNGRPKWMASPGQGGRDPQYRSQKPGPGGNEDELFSDNINKNPAPAKPVDPDSFYIW